jgi:hypothetical protein
MMLLSKLDDEKVSPRILLTAAILLLVIITPVILWLVTTRSNAAFADSEVLEANHLGAGRLDLGIGAETVTFQAHNLAPGDLVSGQLELINNGTLPLVLELSGTSDGDALSEWLRFDLWKTSTQCEPGDIGTRFTDDAVLSTEPTILIGASDTTNVVRLAPAEGSIFCLGAQLSLDSPNFVQGRQTDLTLLVNATHDIEAES